MPASSRIVLLWGLAVGLAVAAGDGDPGGVFVVTSDGSALDRCVADGGDVKAFDTGDPEHGQALRWTVPDGVDYAALSIRHLPGDIRPYRRLRLRVHAPARPAQRLYVRLASDGGSLEGILPLPREGWGVVELSLPDLFVRSELDAEHVEWFQIVSYRGGAFALEMDDVELATAQGGWRWTEEEEKARADAPVVRVADFEDPASASQCSASQSTAEVEEVDGPGHGHALRWVQPARNEGGWLTLVRVPPDIRPFRHLRFRARVADGKPGSIYVRLRSKDGTVGALLPDLGKAWTVVDLLLPEMSAEDDFDPAAVRFLRLVCFESSGFTIDVDDIELHREGPGWRYSAEERREMGIDPTAPEYRIADFERDTAMTLVEARNSEIERTPLKRGRTILGHALHWTLGDSGDYAGISLLQVPQDIRDYRWLWFRARAERKTCPRIFVVFQSMNGQLGKFVEGLDRNWRDVEVALPDMEEQDKFDPADVRVLRLGIYEVKAGAIELDDVRLVKGAGGWKRTGEEQLAHVFGASRARGLKAIDTDHFAIWTDSAAARSKFPRELEKTHDFICEALGLTEMPGRLPVYIFQNPNLYFDFCVRQGWTRQAAEGTAGHAGTGYFATYYQAPGSATVTHELTHAIFQRLTGDGGGSWFQEGVAVFVEELWQKRSAAVTFSPRLRSGSYVPLEELVKIRTLAEEEDVKGGARSPEALYLEAGAFFEYLRRGPLSESAPGAVRALALLDSEDSGFATEVERILGAPLAEIEKRWHEWGDDPPRPARR